MATKPTMVQLTEELVTLLDEQAAKKEVSRSALIREILEEHLADEREALIDRQIVEGYTRIPPGTPDEWGDLEAQADRARLAALRRLDEEERRAGHEPW